MKASKYTKMAPMMEAAPAKAMPAMPMKKKAAKKAAPKMDEGRGHRFC